MEKQIILIKAFTILIFTQIYSQNWEQLNQGTNNSVRTLFADTISNKLYVGGSFKYIGNPLFDNDTILVNAIAEWDGSQFSPLGTGQDFCNNFNCAPVDQITRYKDEIYCSARNPTFGSTPVKGIARWNGLEWDSVGTGVESSNGGNGAVLDMLILEDKLYVGGIFSQLDASSANSLATWDGENWEIINFPSTPSHTPTISALEWFNDKLYVAGNFTVEANGEQTQDILAWDGENWETVYGGLIGQWAWITDIIIFDNELYISGFFKKSEGNIGNKMMKLGLNSWEEVGSGVLGENTNIHAMEVFENELYIAGIFDFVGDSIPANNIAKWDGENWCGLGSVFNNRIQALEVFNEELYIGGGFTEIDGEPVAYIAKWTGGNFVDTCSSIVSTTNQLPEENLFLLFPNPVRHNLQIQISNQLQSNERINLSIYNLLGQRVYRSNISSGSNSIDVSTFPSGTYFIDISTSERLFLEKIVIQ